MNELTITCPNCKTEIRLTESLAAPLIEATRVQFEAQLAQKDAEIVRREAAIKAQQAEVSRAEAAIEDQVSARLTVERDQIAATEARKARLILAAELDGKAREIATLNEVLQERDAKLTEAQEAQADVIRRQRDLDDARREVELTVERRIQEGLENVRARARQDAEDSLQLKVREREQQIASMEREIDSLKRKVDQGSQQLQGEVHELDLEAILRAKFPRDMIEPVAKGERGADLLQRIFNAVGQPCGSILWEAKRTRNWSDAWLSKLRDDQRAAKADLALIVSHALPKEMTASFDLIDGVWVSEPRCAVPVAIALRESLITLAAARQAGEGQQTKMELIYQYLTGPRFRHRVEAIVEKFVDMQADLDRERRTMTKAWSKREEQIRGVIETTAGMYGDMQGIAGRTLQEIDGLSMPLLDGPVLDGV